MNHQWPISGIHHALSNLQKRGALAITGMTTILPYAEHELAVTGLTAKSAGHVSAPLAIVLEGFISAPPPRRCVRWEPFRPIARFFAVPGSDASGVSGWWVGLGSILVRAMSGAGSTASSKMGAAPLAVFSSRGGRAFGSCARPAQTQQRFCERDCLASACERPGRPSTIFAKASKNFHEVR
jgi:hypothetical protein